MTPQEYIQRLTETSTKKYKLLQDMLSITKAQAETIKDEGVEELERLIAVKQMKIDEIDKLDEQFNVYFLRLKKELNVKSLDEMKATGISGIKELQDITGEVMTLIKEISDIEKQNSANARNLLDKFSSEIKKINQSKAVNKAYSAPPPIQSPSYFIDKKK